MSKIFFVFFFLFIKNTFCENIEINKTLDITKIENIQNIYNAPKNNFSINRGKSVENKIKKLLESYKKIENSIENIENKIEEISNEVKEPLYKTLHDFLDAIFAVLSFATLLLWSIIDRLNTKHTLESSLIEKEPKLKEQFEILIRGIAKDLHHGALNSKAKILSRARHINIISWLVVLITSGIVYVSSYLIYFLPFILPFGEIYIVITAIISIIIHQFIIYNFLPKHWFKKIFILLLFAIDIILPFFLRTNLLHITFYILAIVSILILSLYGIEALFFIMSFHLKEEPKTEFDKQITRKTKAIRIFCTNRILKSAINRTFEKN